MIQFITGGNMRKKLGLLFVGFFVLFMASSAVAQNADLPKWIWYPEETNPAEDAPVEPRYFVKIIDIDSAVVSAEMEIAVDNTYKLYVNGGNPVEEGDNWQVANEFSIANKLKKGKNVIAIEATNQGGPAGLILKGKIVLKTGKRETVFVSDSTWMTSKELTEGWIDGKLDKSWVKALEIGELGIPPWNTNLQAEMLFE